MSDTWYSDDDDDSDSCDSLACNPCIPIRRSSPDTFHKLKVIVVYTTPWSSQPGAPSNPALPTINGPPASAQIPVSAGLPWRVRLAARPTTIGKPVERRLDPALSTTVPSGWNTIYNVPNIVFMRYGAALKHATSFDFDFGRRNRYREGVGKMAAYGGGKSGNVQASVTFSYDWSLRADGHGRGPHHDHDHDHDHEDEDDGSDRGCEGRLKLPTFTITGCTTQNAKFIVLSDFSDFVPENEDDSFIPVVVLGIQQWCGDSCDDCVDDAGGQYAPLSCKQEPLDCVTLSKLKAGCAL